MRDSGRMAVGASVAALALLGAGAGYHEPYDGGPRRPRFPEPKKKKSKHKRKFKGSKAAKKANRK